MAEEWSSAVRFGGCVSCEQDRQCGDGWRRRNHCSRALLQVRVQDVAESNDLFEQLMGDVVEPRRQFIQKNALAVTNLDT